MEPLVLPPENHGGYAGLSVPTVSTPGCTKVAPWAHCVIATRGGMVPPVASVGPEAPVVPVEPVVPVAWPAVVVGLLLAHAASSSPNTATVARILRIDSSLPKRPAGVGGSPEPTTRPQRQEPSRGKLPLWLPPEAADGDRHADDSPDRNDEDVGPLPPAACRVEVRPQHGVGEVVDREELRHDHEPRISGRERDEDAREEQQRQH